MAKTTVKPDSKQSEKSASANTPSATNADKSAEVAATNGSSSDANGSNAPLTGKALLQKVKELSHLAKRETAKQCGYVKTNASGGVRTDLSGFYDAVLTAKGVKLDETSRDSRGKVATNKATVHKNGQLLIGSAYTKQMGLKEGDTFTIKLGYKHIHLIQDDN
jgi:AbrB-like transcriptional regulator